MQDPPVCRRRTEEEEADTVCNEEECDRFGGERPCHCYGAQEETTEGGW